MSNQFPGGGPPQNPYDIGIQNALARMRNEWQGDLNRAAGGLRKASDAQLARLAGRMDELTAATQHLSATRTGPEPIPGLIRIEDIPGRRVPYNMLVDIPIGPNTTSVREASFTVSQEGPFVAVAKCATFQSAFEFQTNDVTTGNPTGRFAGRSFGRFRPISSAFDMNDSQHNSYGDSGNWWLTALLNGAATQPLPTATLGMPSNQSSFRTMEFDGRISVINAGSSYPRQNISVPSSMWSTNITGPRELGALDFFERGEVVTIRAQPTHTNNPPAGNVQADCILNGWAAPGAAYGWPFVEGQYDAHEGICTPGGALVGIPGTPGPAQIRMTTTDETVQRLPNGILTIGFEGYRIIQPIGPPG